jgi:hypothetical protein
MGRTGRSRIVSALLGGVLWGLTGCTEIGPLAPGGSTRAIAPALSPLFVWEATGDESDSWETMTQAQGTYYEVVAADQTPQPSDGLDPWKPRVCPNDQLIQRNAQLRMNHTDTGEEIDLEFRGPFEFMRHVSTSGSPYPTALYRFRKPAYSYDKRYLAPANNNVLLACDGNYVVNNAMIRFWRGFLLGKLYNGPIESNPDCEDSRFSTARYNPYGTEDEECDAPSSGSSNGVSCIVDWIRIEYWDGLSWQLYWFGSATVCD